MRATSDRNRVSSIISLDRKLSSLYVRFQPFQKSAHVLLPKRAIFFYAQAISRSYNVLARAKSF